MPSTWREPAQRSAAAWLASEPPEVAHDFLANLSEDTLLALPYLFEFWAMEHQVPPEGDWKTWVVLGGRGAGKTRAGAEWVRRQVEGNLPTDAGKARRVALVGETIEQAREVMVFGDSGILACSPPDRRPEWRATRKQLEWPNGATAQVYSASDPESLRGPQFDGAWVDEMGCAAIERGTNQPNVFLDPKSSESAVPYFSNGQRDDLIQSQYLRAVHAYFGDVQDNPISDIYGQPMVDMQNAHVWAWDARPWPEFPNNLELWSDGENYARGHWINGRSAAVTLADVVAEICGRSGVTEYDVETLYGSLKGFAVSDVQSARATLQPLMLSFGFDSIERDGQLIFINRQGVAVAELDESRFVYLASEDSSSDETRHPRSETADRVRLGYVKGDGDYQLGLAEAVYPDVSNAGVSHTEVPIVLSSGEAQTVAHRWLSEARVARDVARFALAPSDMQLGAGDVVDVSVGTQTTRLRIDKVEDAGSRLVEATRVEAGVYQSHLIDDEADVPDTIVPPLPVFSTFLDLPLMSGSEVEHAPHIAIAADPWPGSVAVYSAPADNGYVLNTRLERASIVGSLEETLVASRAGLWDLSAGVRVTISGGSLDSAGRDDVLNGANLAAIGDGSADHWELIQFERALLVGENKYQLSGLLRGQLGSDGTMPADWPAGSRFVLLNGAPEQIQLDIAARDLARHYRIGPAARSYDDVSYTHDILAFSGIGMRPYGPCHLRQAINGAGDRSFSWIRRTRIDGDSWSSVEVPLGEASEAYNIRVLNGATVLRDETTFLPVWDYPIASQAADGLPTSFAVEIAQMSDRFGAGPYSRIEIDE